MVLEGNTLKCGHGIELASDPIVFKIIQWISYFSTLSLISKIAGPTPKCSDNFVHDTHMPTGVVYLFRSFHAHSNLSLTCSVKIVLILKHAATWYSGPFVHPSLYVCSFIYTVIVCHFVKQSVKAAGLLVKAYRTLKSSYPSYIANMHKAVLVSSWKRSSKGSRPLGFLYRYHRIDWSVLRRSNYLVLFSSHLLHLLAVTCSLYLNVR